MDNSVSEELLCDLRRRVLENGLRSRIMPVSDFESQRYFSGGEGEFVSIERAVEILLEQLKNCQSCSQKYSESRFDLGLLIDVYA